MKVSIVMPCLNEAETLEICVLKAKTWASKQSFDVEIIVADNGSTDGSQDIALKNGVILCSVTDKGYGAALQGGIRMSRGEYVIMGDSDDSYNFENLDSFVSKLDEGYDLVMGNRFKGGIEPGAMPWKNRYIGNPILSMIGRFLFSSDIKDFHCGLRGFRREAINSLNLSSNGMEFASEMVIKASLSHYRIAEVPTTLSVDGRNRPPHLRPWRDGWRHLRFMLLMSPAKIFIYPGLLLLVVSLPLYLILLFGPLHLGGIVLSKYTLLYLQSFLLLGISSVGVGLLIKQIGMTSQVFPSSARRTGQMYFEKGLCASAASFIAGIYFCTDSIVVWFDRGFKYIDDVNLLPVVSLSTLFLGMSGIFFLLSAAIGFIEIHMKER